MNDPERQPGLAAPLALAAALALVAGYVDAVCFDRVFAVFPANQSGNAVLLGIALGDGRGSEAWRPAVAIFGFAVGVAVAIRLGSRIRHRRRPELLLGLEVVFLAPLAIVLLDTARPRTELGDVTLLLLLLAASLAMGIQTEVIGRVAGVAVATTYQSGAIVRLAELVARRAPVGAGHPTVAPGLTVLVVVLASYVTGAATGAAAQSARAAMTVPVAALAAIAVVLRITSRDDPEGVDRRSA